MPTRKGIIFKFQIADILKTCSGNSNYLKNELTLVVMTESGNNRNMETYKIVGTSKLKKKNHLLREIKAKTHRKLSDLQGTTETF